LSQEKVDDLANVFLVDTEVKDLSKSQQAQARNVTKSIFVVQQDDVEVKMNFVNNVDVSPDESGGAIDAVSAHTRKGCKDWLLTAYTERRRAKYYHAIQYHTGR
jgi:hypothetical protein